MARPGPLPSPTRIGHSPQADWTDVADVPFVEGEARELPPAEWHELVRRWWGVLRVMPHAVRWTEGDWLSAIDLAFLKQKFYTGLATSGEVSEIRKREDLLGFTTEARQKLRIRYVSPKGSASESRAEAAAPAGGDATVTPIVSRRRRDLQ